MALRKILILRCLAERGLEGRTTPIQTTGNFLTASKAGIQDRELPTDAWTSACAGVTTKERSRR
jgi:hypothetical protein